MWLDLFLHVALDEGPVIPPRVPIVWWHRRYVTKYGLEGDAAEIVVRTATAFRFVDDVLDEHGTREDHPSRWRETSVPEAVLDAGMLVRGARKKAEAAGLGPAYVEMLKDVTDAVRLEIDVEESRAVVSSAEDWERVARREASFRAFVARLCGRDPEELYREGLEAQRKDDLLGATKHGREDTDTRLRRPLWQNVSTRR